MMKHEIDRLKKEMKGYRSTTQPSVMSAEYVPPIVEYKVDGRTVREYNDKDSIPKYDGTDMLNAFAVGCAIVGLISALMIKYM